MHAITKTALAALCVAASSLSHANLLVNGDFEASSDPVTTPPGWYNIGHSDGVISYASFNTPAYDGLYFYDLGGYGDPYGPIGDGIGQDFATTAGTSYTLTFGLSSENREGDEILTVSVGDATFSYLLTVDGTGDFQKAFTTISFNFTAVGAMTSLTFIHTGGAAGGNNDPLIDAVSVMAVPEPGTVAMMLAGLGVMGGIARRRSRG